MAINRTNKKYIILVIAIYLLFCFSPQHNIAKAIEKENVGNIIHKTANIIHTASIEEIIRDKINSVEMLFTEEDVKVVAKTLWGEARGCGTLGMQKVVWCICNRVDKGFASTPSAVCKAPNQFYGYRSSNPVTSECEAIARDVLTRWSYEKAGFNIERELGPNYCWFYGNGVENIFRDYY